MASTPNTPNHNTPNLMFANLRLEVLLKNVASRVLRDIFTRRYTRSTGLEWKNGTGKCKEFLKKEGKFTKWMPIQKDKNMKGDLSCMDLAHLAQILHKLRWTSIETTPNITEEEKRALETENSLINQIKTVRNDYTHLAINKTIKYASDNKLNEFWETARKALLELGGEALTEEIDDIHNSEFKGLTYSDAALSEENMTKSRSLRDDGDKFIGEKQFQQAIDCYSRALELEELSHVERGMLYSNRSYANLLLSESENLSENESKARIMQALEDARSTTVEHRPSWWKGFYRAAQVYKRMNELKPALISCDHALNLILNKEETDEVVKLRNEIRKLAEDRGLRFDSSSDRPTEASVLHDLKQFASQTGISLPEPISLSVSVDRLLNSGDAKALGIGSVLKGHCYFYGLGGYVRDTQMGAKFYTKALMKQNPYGFYYAGLCHLTGQGFPKKLQDAKELLKNATKHSETASVSMCALGKLYETEFEPGFTQDFAKAACWYSRASEVGNGEASNLLANLYNEGKGVEENKSTAISYWIKAAEQGYETAMERLAVEYLEMGNLDEAEKWFSSAIDAGCLSAFLNRNSFEEKLVSLRFDSV